MKIYNRAFSSTFVINNLKRITKKRMAKKIRITLTSLALITNFGISGKVLAKGLDPKYDKIDITIKTFGDVGESAGEAENELTEALKEEGFEVVPSGDGADVYELFVSLQENDNDLDNDGIPNAEDPDNDGDGVSDDNEDIKTLEDNDDSVSDEKDTDGDGISDDKDDDIDGDGITNDKDTDDDGDGTPDSQEGDNDLDNDGIPNDKDDDIDGDGITNDKDPDDDNDGVPDDKDLDDDNDGTPDSEEDGDGDSSQFYNDSKQSRFVLASFTKQSIFVLASFNGRAEDKKGVVINFRGPSLAVTSVTHPANSHSAGQAQPPPLATKVPPKNAPTQIAVPAEHHNQVRPLTPEEKQKQEENDRKYYAEQEAKRVAEEAKRAEQRRLASTLLLIFIRD